MNNQNFVQIPFLKFINQLIYECRIEGITVELQEESYTSKASFLNKDEMPIYRSNNTELYKFSGKRVKRGLYKTAEGRSLNADVNGSYNILRKFLKAVKNTDIYNSVDFIEVCSTPSVFTVNA